MIEPGTTLKGRYEIRERIDKGGFALVYSAWDTTFHRTVAIKVVEFEDDEDDGEEGRTGLDLLNEARVVASSPHPNILDVYDFGEEGPQTFLVMPFADGGNLHQLLRREGPLSLDLTDHYLRQIAAGLDHAHHLRVIHRDLKPQNLLLFGQDRKRLVISDFGVAKAVLENAMSANTRLIGTPPYMAPEQFEGRISYKSDIYALGIVLYRMLAGETPFKGRNYNELRTAHTTQTPLPISQKRADSSTEIDNLIWWALAKSPEARPQSATDLSLAFEQAVRRIRASDPTRTSKVNLVVPPGLPGPEATPPYVSGTNRHTDPLVGSQPPYSPKTTPAIPPVPPPPVNPRTPYYEPRPAVKAYNPPPVQPANPIPVFRPNTVDGSNGTPPPPQALDKKPDESRRRLIAGLIILAGVLLVLVPLLLLTVFSNSSSTTLAPLSAASPTAAPTTATGTTVAVTTAAPATTLAIVTTLSASTTAAATTVAAATTAAPLSPSPTTDPNAQIFGDGQKAIEAKDWEKAINLFEGLKANNYRVSDVNVFLAKAYCSYGKEQAKTAEVSRIKDVLDKCIGLTPDDGDAKLLQDSLGKYILGRDFALQKNWPAALPNLEDVYFNRDSKFRADLGPILLDAYFQYSQVLIDQKDFTQALDLICKRAKSMPQDAGGDPGRADARCSEIQALAAPTPTPTPRPTNTPVPSPCGRGGSGGTYTAYNIYVAGGSGKVGNIAGIVIDRNKRPIAGATLTINGPTTVTVTTGGDGRYSSPSLPQGAYLVSVVSAPGRTVCPVGPAYAEVKGQAGSALVVEFTENPV